ncbi:MAG TPA: hypothetical protein VNK04_23200 [Gemmataceae bacterium]|jgi:hypothetical protein|nr:hypothetical protein [Gemmataceae bacterium]
MHQILPHLLWVGHAEDGRDSRRIFDTGIQALVQLAVEEPPVQPPRQLIYCRFPLLDGAGNPGELLSLAVSTVATLLQMRTPTLIFCGAGISRSPAIAAAALAVAHQQPAEHCLQQVARYHPCDLSPGLWDDVVRMVRSGRVEMR